MAISQQLDFAHLLTRPDVLRMLQDIPHQLKNMQDEVISEHQFDSTTQEFKQVSLNSPLKETLGLLSLPPTHLPYLQLILERKLQLYQQFLSHYALEQSASLLTRDLLGLYQRSEDKSLPRSELFTRFIQLLQNIYPFQICSLHLIESSTKLKKFMVWGSHLPSPIPHCPSDTIISSIVAANQKLLWAEKNQHFPYLPHSIFNDPLKNCCCFPLIFQGRAYGVLCLYNYPVEFKSEELYPRLVPWISLLSSILGEDMLYNERQVLMNANMGLRRYLSSQTLQRMQNPGKENLAGTKKHIVVLFAKIDDFNTIYQKLKISSLRFLLNFSFEQIYAVLNAQEGHLNKILIPSFLVTWNHPFDQKDPEEMALQAALQLQSMAQKVLLPLWQEYGIADFSFSIGINSGIATAANVGSSEFLDDTVIGDVVNTAQRLSAKALPSEIWVHHQVQQVLTANNTCSFSPVREVEDVHLKGKEQTCHISVYQYHP